MEWAKNNEFNSFNSWKGLLYSKWYEQIASGNFFLPPVEASLDPIHKCNLHCLHCNANRYLSNGSVMKLSNSHYEKLVRFLANWGVQAICFGGGGEPLMHQFTSKAIELTTSLGVHASMATNGTLIHKHDLEALSKCRWIGISVDSATADTYYMNKGSNMFRKAIDNIQLLSKYISKHNSNCDLSFKFLIMPNNQHEIYKACVLAKELGVKDFHARPADYQHQGMGKLQLKDNGYDIDYIREQFQSCHELESDTFHVYTVMHKFNDNFTPKRNFTQCYAAPCCIQICADGNVYHCPDQRFQEFFKIGEHFPNPENILSFWGGEKHRQLVFKDGCQNCHNRCTFAPYNRQCEELFIKKTDPMCWRFI